jgi:uncharacterized membrane protein YbaN (DUF454 family)
MSKKLTTIDDILDKYSVESNPFKKKLFVFLGLLFVVFAIIGIWIPGWPTVSWAVPAAFLFSLSNKKLFVWTLTNRFFGSAIFDYYASGKTLSSKVKNIIMLMIAFMTVLSSFFVFSLSTLGNGDIFDHSSWNGTDEYALGSVAIIIFGIIGILYIYRINLRKT